MFLYNLIFFIISGLFLAISCIFIVKSLVKISRHLGISEFTISFIVMAFATSLPELFVGIISALNGTPQLSLGNILGANIIDITWLVGIFVLLARGISLKSKEIEKDDFMMLASVFILIGLFIIGNSLSRIDGVILLVLFSFNTYNMLKKRKIEKKDKKNQDDKFVLNIFIFLVALGVLFLSSHYAVKYALLIATELNLSQLIIGIFMVSFATTLPELVFGVESILLRHKDMAIGDQTGTVFLNICLILGLVSVISPISVSLSEFLIPALFLLFSCILFLVFAKSGKKLSRIEGIILILVYVAFVAWKFL